MKKIDIVSEEDEAIEIYLETYLTKKNRHGRQERIEEYNHKCAAEAGVQQSTTDKTIESKRA